MMGSWIGYSWGCVIFWRRSKKSTLLCAQKYPAILSHALSSEFDVEVPSQIITDNNNSTNEASKGDDRISMDKWIMQGGMSRMAFAVLAYQTCQEDILEMQRVKRQQLVEDASAR